MPAVDRIHRVVDGAVHHREVRNRLLRPLTRDTISAFAAFTFHCVTASARATAGAAKHRHDCDQEQQAILNLLLLPGRDGFDDAKRIELGALRHQRSLPLDGAPNMKKQISSSGTWMTPSKRTRVPAWVSSSAAERALCSRAVRSPA